MSGVNNTNSKINVNSKLFANTLNNKGTSNIQISQIYNDNIDTESINLTLNENTSEIINIIEIEKGLKELDKVYNENLELIKDDIKEKKEELKQIENEINKISISKNMSESEIRAYTEENGLFDIDFQKLDELRIEVKELENSEIEIQTFLKQNQNKLEQVSYMKIAESDDYKKFFEKYNGSNIDYDLLKSVGYDIAYYKSESGDYSDVNKIALVDLMIQENPDAYILRNNYPSLKETFENYQHMSKEQRKMYIYLFDTKGEEAAEKYFKVIENQINQAKGASAAAEFISKLDLKDEEKLKTNIANFFDVSGKGLADGIATFSAGIRNLIKNDETLSAEEYEKIIILQYLQENSKLYDELYELDTSIGNMMPSIITSILVSYYATPEAGAKVGSALMGISAAGNAKHIALTQGNDLLSSMIYGTLIGASETTLGYLLGGIPGLSKSSNILKEGLEEFSQEYIDVGLQAALLGNEINLDELHGNARKSAIMGMLSSGLIKGSAKIFSVTIDGASKMLTQEQLAEYLNENNVPNTDNITLGETIINQKESNAMKNDPRYEKNSINTNNIKKDTGKIFNVSNFNETKSISKQQYANQIKNLANSFPEYSEELNSLLKKVNKEGKVTESSVYELSELYSVILKKCRSDISFFNRANNIRSLLYNIDNAEKYVKYERQSDGSYSILAYDSEMFDANNLVDIVNYALANNIDLTKDHADINEHLTQNIAKIQEELLNSKLNNYYGDKNFIKSNTDNIQEAYISLLNSQYVTDSEKNQLLEYKNNIENLSKEINDIATKNKISREDYNNLSEKYQSLLNIENELSTINAKAWDRYYEKTNAALIHCYSGSIVNPNQFSGKICTSLMSDNDGTLLSNCGIAFRPDFSEIDTIAANDAGSWDTTKKDFIERNTFSWQWNNDTKIFYEGGEHSKLFSPEYIENSIAGCKNHRTYTEIVLKNNNLKAYKYFVTENATADELNNICQLAERDGVEVELINSKTFERTVIKTK